MKESDAVNGSLPMRQNNNREADAIATPPLLRYRFVMTILVALICVTAALPIIMPGDHNIALPNDMLQHPTEDKHLPIAAKRIANLTLRTPIFIASLPKSGTTSAQQFFTCGGQRAAHTYVRSRKKPNERTGRKHGGSMRLGICMDVNMQEGKPLFDGCGRYAAFSDAGYVDFQNERCFYPSIEALPEFYKSYPDATIILFYRNATRWYQSLASYGGGKIFKKWKSCNLTAVAGLSYFANETDEDHFVRFYEWHRQNLHTFAKNHPSIRYLEFSLESEATGRALEVATGLPSECWQDCAPRRDCSKASAAAR